MQTLRFPLILAGLVLLAAVFGPASWSPAPAFAAPSKIDANLLQLTANGGHAPFLVVLKEQADLSGAGRLATKAEKGRFVLDALQRTANRTQPPVRAALDKLGLHYAAYYIVNLFKVEDGTRDALLQLAARDDIARVEGNPRVHMALPSPNASQSLAPGGIEWNLHKVRAVAVWNKGFTGKGIVFANADTGVYWQHPALKTHYRGYSANGTVNHNYNWWDAVHDDPAMNNPCGINLKQPCDDYGHGTHTLGTGVGDDGKGNQIGVAPGAKWIACRNMDAGVGTPARYIECFQFFLAPWDLNGKNPDPNKNADVISNSWTCPLGPPPNGEGCSPLSLQEAVKVERAAGIVVVAAAGNSGPQCSTTDEPPSNYNNAVTVGATDSSDILASFSSRGPSINPLHTLLKPDLSAPGVQVRSSLPGGAYGTESGTSMATPHVAGAVALLWQARPKLRGNVTATENALFKSSNPHVQASGSCGGTTSSMIPNNLFGYGRLDILAAVNSVAP